MMRVEIQPNEEPSCHAAMTTRVPALMCGGTMVRTPFDSMAGL